ncbi:MAG TPA: PQQ-dependent sugar dehydrogenase [Telluria sp.]
MLIDRARFILMSFALFLLVSCGGGGDNDDDGPPPTGTATLAVTIANLPAGVSGAVKITGPSGFSREITQTTTLPNLAAGAYIIAASNVLSGSTTYIPGTAEQRATLAAGDSTTITVSYGASPLTLGLREVARVNDAVFATSPPGDARLFIVERSGRIRILRDGSMLTLPFLDLSGRVLMEGEGGLLSMAFHPQYATNGQFFVYYTDFQRNIVVDRYTVSANSNIADPTSALQIISIPHPDFTNHYGGMAAFGSDGFLYLGTGDGGGGGDPLRNGQNFATLLGKMLRLDVNNATAARRYSIPPGNPYVNTAGRRAEIWAVGLRNPFRFAFDTSGLYIADAGQNRREEINLAGLAQGGLNYGWNVMEGTLCFGAVTCSQAGLTLPAHEYDSTNNTAGCAVIGGYVYRGKAVPELAGRYFYSDYCQGFLKSFHAGMGTIREHVDWNIPDIGQVVSFGSDADGELYLVAWDGRIYKIIRG